jgi:lambda repressor-like predicted transcriptional regulator
MAAKYAAGATVYEVADEFGCNRATVADRLKRAGVKLRLSSPTLEEIDEMVSLHEKGLSLVRVGRQVGYCANTVRSCLKSRTIN